MPSLTFQQQKNIILLQKEFDSKIKAYYSQIINTTFLNCYIKVLAYEYTNSCDQKLLESIKISIDYYNKGDKDGVVNTEAYKFINIITECNNISLLQDLVKFFIPVVISM